MGRAPCCDKNGLKKGPWTPEEDQKLLDYVQKHGHGRWRTLPKNAGLSRCGKSCRLRWTNYLRPDIKRGKFSFEEEETIIQLHSILGNKWSAIAARLPGRTDNEVKNFWNTHIRKRLLRMGIDPVTHSPRLDLLDLSSLLTPSLYSNPSQLEISRLLGVEPAVNTELLRIATGLLSSQRQNAERLRQNNLHEQQQRQLQQHQQQQFPNPPMQQQLIQPSFSAQQLPNPVDQQIPVCTTSAAALMVDGAQLMQANTGQLYFGDDLANWACSLPESFSMPQNSELFGVGQAPMDTFGLVSCDAPDFGPSSSEGFGLPSVLSTPASSPTPLNSSSTYINSTATTNTEDERDSYCSSVLNFQIPDFLDVGGIFM